MIEGLMLTIPREELRRLLEQRVDEHERRADWWKREQVRAPEEQTEDQPLLPELMCENEAERHEWRAAVLGFIRDRIEPAAVYRLGETDLAFGELLPEKPGSVEQEEYEGGHASDSISNDSREEQANWEPGNWPPRREEARTNRSRQTVDNQHFSRPD